MFDEELSGPHRNMLEREGLSMIHMPSNTETSIPRSQAELFGALSLAIGCLSNPVMRNDNISRAFLAEGPPAPSSSPPFLEGSQHSHSAVQMRPGEAHEAVLPVRGRVE